VRSEYFRGDTTFSLKITGLRNDRSARRFAAAHQFASLHFFCLNASFTGHSQNREIRTLPRAVHSSPSLKKGAARKVRRNDLDIVLAAAVGDGFYDRVEAWDVAAPSEDAYSLFHNSTPLIWTFAGSPPSGRFRA
jgi:hypothetical protein